MSLRWALPDNARQYGLVSPLPIASEPAAMAGLGRDGVTAKAVVFAVARGWVIVEAGHSICLTDSGRRLVR